MNQKPSCRLCDTEMNYYANTRNRDYYRCPNCDSIQLDKNQLLTPDSEKKRYDTHNNDVFDPGYQKFVSPITDYIFNNYNQSDIWLDFGAGPGPVISKLLIDKGYNIKQYDPHFYPNHDLLKEKYDYVIACEVIEHFYHPKMDFKRLNEISKAKGCWIFMTDIYDESIDFKEWYYKNDETHVIFYTKKTLEFIKSLFSFEELLINNRLIVFSNKNR